ncbi:MAG: DNA gyrase subunit B [Clostridiales bacterium]|nr:DNA gyrase subunit B [Clostridiales bacterium]
MGATYDAKDIKVLEGLDAVRLRPGMYIGTTGVKGLHHILWEIVDNSMDEVTNGYGDTIDIKLYSDGSVSVEDNGRGIPVDIHPQLGVSAVEVVFTQLHAGGKFDNDNYSHSGGLHGVGASVTNALSEWLIVEVYKNGKTYKMEFESREVDGKVKGGIPKYSLFDTGVKTNKHGTFIRFKPDKRIFETVALSFDTIKRRIKELAFLNKGAHITLTDERNYEEPIKVEYCYDGGIVDFVLDLNETKTPCFKKPIYLTGSENNIDMELAFQYTDGYTDNIFSYVNNIPTTEGGTHETGFKSGLTRVMNDVARKMNVLKDKDENLKGDDFLEGITAVLSIKMQNVQFEGQTKTKLGNPDARVAIEHMVVSELNKFFDNASNKSIADAILKKAIMAAKVREEARKAKEITRQKNSIENFNLVGKLSNCTGRRAADNELYIVEGDSAGGTCKQARNRHYQAILPLRGKPLNAEKKRIDQVLENVEIRTIISALGCGIGDDYNEDDLNFHKVIILSDADQDGGHIRAILLTFFFRYMKELITGGHVFIGMPPLYKVYKKDIVEYAYNDDELEKAKNKVGRGFDIQRYKGLGEMNSEQLWETTMDPKRRTLIQVSIDDAAEAERLVSVLMGDAIEQRKAFIIENANFNREDNFKVE